MRSGAWSGVLLIVLGGVVAYAQHDPLPAGPRLGQPLSAGELTRWDVTVFSDGEGLPPGSGSVAQGQALYLDHCVACHGRGAIGLTAPALASASEPLTSAWPDKTIGSYWPYATTLFDFIRRAKPIGRPGLFSDAEVYALTAYLLHLNSLLDADALLDAVALVAIAMPNRNGFIGVDAQPGEARPGQAQPGQARPGEALDVAKPPQKAAEKP